ncbi:MAG: transposase, partial [Polyangiaceae bacterium]|nr:transposase [Polyangiaceae bacterium]
MFRKRDPQAGLFETTNLLPQQKRARLTETWAETFRQRALPLIQEDPFAPLFDEGNGRPNVPVQILVAVLILKDMFNLTDDETLEQVEFSLLWQHALRLAPEDAHVCQKTLHNFRTRLLAHDGGRLAFEQITAAIIQALGIRVSRQRLDSTHIVSNFAVLTRLGLFCETLRVALTALRRSHPKIYGRVPEELRERYVKADGGETRFRDAKSDEARRRLDVCGRDAYRVLSVCEGKAAGKLKEVETLKRLFEEQCKLVEDDQQPSDDDADSEQGGVPVVVKEPKDISSASLQTPHDPDATYSGHKGKGYEVQIAETCHAENEVEILTHVDVTPSFESDASATIPVLNDLAERGLQPQELVADTTYGSAENAVYAARLGTELVSPVSGSTPTEVAPAAAEDERTLTPADFTIDLREQTALCPAGVPALSVEAVDERGKVVELRFDADKCVSCPFVGRCPAKLEAEGDATTVRVNLEKANLEQRRRAEARGELRPRYRIRAGIEATNSELKRKHGLGRLRVRGRARVALAVYFKALACNV